MRRITFLLLVPLACTPAASGTDSDSDASTGTTAGTDGPTTGAEGDLNPHVLGDHASQACRDAMAQIDDFLAATAAADTAMAGAVYSAPSLQGYVMSLDAANMRDDDAWITATLAQGDAEGAALAEGHLFSAFAAHARANLASIETGAEDKYAAWDEAHCLWQGALKTLADRADAAGFPKHEPTADIIEQTFAAGHDAITGEPPATTYDEWRLPPARQIIEKTMFLAVHRDILDDAYAAAGALDPVLAARALGLFGLLKDRLEGRNTPGIAAIRNMLADDPAALEPDFIHAQLDIAFAKRTRSYADQAFVDGLGVPSSYKGAVEGATYAKLIAYGMALEMLDSDAYLADWDAYVDLVRTGDDEAAAMAVSQRLVDATCAYQTALGIAVCTGSDDEPAP